MAATAPRLSVVIPAYNEAKRIEHTLDRALAYLHEREFGFEILIVDDGSEDRTQETVRARAESEIRLIPRADNRGKGAAVRDGVRASHGKDLILLTDADLSAPIDELWRLETALSQGADVACGSRGLDASLIRVKQPVFRRQLGNMFNRIARGLGLTAFRDTQCGFKLFRAEAARNIFSRCTIDGFAFDVECLYFAERLGYRTAEVPVSWAHVPESRVRLATDSARMLRDIVRFRMATWRTRTLPPSRLGACADPNRSAHSRRRAGVEDHAPVSR